MRRLKIAGRESTQTMKAVDTLSKQADPAPSITKISEMVLSSARRLLYQRLCAFWKDPSQSKRHWFFARPFQILKVVGNKREPEL